MNFVMQNDWRLDIHEQFMKIKSQGSNMPQLEEELIQRRREELRLEKYLILRFTYNRS